MSSATPKARFHLLKDCDTADADGDLDDLRRKLMALPDFAQVELAPDGKSTILALVPARNQMQINRLKALVNEKVTGWRVLEEQSYPPPSLL
jgi:hypothetical protein